MKTSKTEEKLNDKLDRVIDQFDDKIETTRENLKGKVDHYAEIGMAGAEAARDSLTQFSERIGHSVEDAVHRGIDRVKASSEDARKIVKKYPLYTVAGVVAVSFLAGMICGKVSSRR
ncbi:MAG: hypothetical protein IT286_02645 [Proteobacteria bacterium]|jgi:L-lactate utilization protein LutB|nr:hypothetical protein [Pseudomonadota bacterium]